MTITPEINAYTKKMKVGWFCLEGEASDEKDADTFLRDHLGVDLTCTEFDKWDDRISYSFPIELEETKAKTLKWLRKELKEYVQR